MARPGVLLSAAAPLLAAVLFLAATGGGLDALLRLALWGLVLGGGARLTGGALGSRLAGLPHLAWDGGVALAALMGLLLTAGQIPGLYRPGPLWAVPILLGAGGLLLHRREHRRRLPPGGPAGGSVLPAGLWPALGLVAAAGLLWNRVPPTFFDTLAYHFAQPGLWLAEGVVAPVTWSLMSWFPAGMSALYGLGLAWGGDAAAADANLLLGLLLLVLAADSAGRLWGPAAAWAAFLLMASLPIFLHALAIPAADLAHGTFTFGSLAAWIHWRREGVEVWRRRAAWLAAGAALTKYLGLLLPVGAGVLLFCIPRPGERLSPGRRLRRAAAFLLPSLLLLSPWLAANARVTGNPVAPVLAGLLPVEGLAPGGAAAFRADARGGPPGTGDLRRLAPGLILGEADGGVYPGPAWGWTLPLLLLVAAVWGRRAPGAGPLLVLAGVGFGIWFATFRWERFLVAVSALLAVALSGALVAAWKSGGGARLVIPLAAALALLGAVRAGLSVARFTGGVPVATGLESPDHFRERSFPFARLYRRAAARLPAAARILLVGEMRHHGLDLPHAAPAGFNVHPLVQALAGQPAAASAAAALRAAGFTHLLVDPAWVDRSAGRYPSLAPLGRDGSLRGRLAIFLSGLGPPVDVEGRLTLYVLPEAGGIQRTALPAATPH